MTSNGSSHPSLNPASLPREQRPRLLSSVGQECRCCEKLLILEPQNRKLRHLHGISLRNLALTSTRPQGKASDDEALPHSLKSPTKLLAIPESNLHPSRSVSDLKQKGKGPAQETQWNGHERVRRHENTSPKSPRPVATLQRQDSTPLQRQQIAQDAITRRIGDVFFTLHCDDEDDPIYISEVIERAMNLDFRFFDLNACSSFITRRVDTTVKFWAKPASSEDWGFLMELTLSFPSLQYIGKTLEGFRQPFPENCVLFHLDDGIYTSFTNLPVEQHDTAGATAKSGRTATSHESTSSYDALMRLQTLDECIQDALETRHKLTSEINALITEDADRFRAQDAIAFAEDSLNATKRSVAAARRQVKATRASLSQLRSSIDTRRSAMTEGRQSEADTQDELEIARSELVTQRTQHTSLLHAIIGQRRRVSEDLQSIFTISPLPGRSLAFNLRGLHLPDSDFHDIKASSPASDAIAAALGHVAHVVHLLSLYLNVSLPYPITPRSSTSTVTDPISLMPSTGPSQYGSGSAPPPPNSPDRIFPLYLRNAVLFRAEYGVFLLNKDIELLASKLGLRVLDIRQTLPNLKYVLYVASAGTGQLPTRKAGGVRGLLRDREMEREKVGAGDRDGLEERGQHVSGPGSVATESLKKKILG